MPDITTLLAKFLNDLYAGTLGVTNPITAVQVANGSVGAPSYSFAANATSGVYNAGSGSLGIATGGLFNGSIGFGGQGFWQAPSSGLFGFSAGSVAATPDAGISRTAAATIAVGNGTQGDVSGTVNATIFKSGATAGVTTFGPAAVASITVKGGIITAIS